MGDSPMALTLRERFHPKRFLVGEQPSDDAVTLCHRRIFILPSKSGLCCGLLLCIMLLASVVYNNNLSFILTFLLSSICLVSVLHNFQSMTGLKIKAGHSNPVFAGDVAELKISLHNESAFPRINLFLSAKNAEPVQVNIAPKKRTIAPLKIKTHKRGWQSVGTMTVLSYYPIGLFRAWSPINLAQKLLVYPKPSTHPIIAPQQSLADSKQAKYFTRDGDDFLGLDKYQYGDSLRHIHWKAFAKGQGVQSKRYGSDESPQLILDLEQTPGDNLESRISLLCRWIIDLENAGVKYGLRLSQSLIEPNSGSTHRARCLRELALV